MLTKLTHSQIYGQVESLQGLLAATGEPSNKRRRYTNPIKDLIEPLTHTITSVHQRSSRLQTLLFLIERHWSSFEETDPLRSDIISTLALIFEPLPIVGIAELLGIKSYQVIQVLLNLQAIIQRSRKRQISRHDLPQLPSPHRLPLCSAILPFPPP